MLVLIHVTRRKYRKVVYFLQIFSSSYFIFLSSCPQFSNLNTFVYHLSIYISQQIWSLWAFSISLSTLCGYLEKDIVREFIPKNYCSFAAQWQQILLLLFLILLLSILLLRFHQFSSYREKLIWFSLSLSVIVIIFIPEIIPRVFFVQEENKNICIA